MESSRSEAGGRVARNTTLLTMSLVGQKVLSFLYFLILVRLIGVNSAGDYLSSLSFIGLFSVFIDLGLTQAFIRQTARDKHQGQTDLQIMIGFKLISGVLVAALMIGVVLYLQSIGRFSTEIIFLQIAAIIMVIDSFVIMFLGYYRGVQRLEYESLVIIIHRVTVMIVGITSLYLGAPLIWSMIALLSGSVMNLTFVLWQLWKWQVPLRPRWDWTQLRRLLRIALPFGVAALFVAVYSSSDNIILQVFTDRRDVGLYGTAAKVISAFTQIFPAALVAALFPAMSSLFVTDRQRLGQVFQNAVVYLMVIAVPLMIVLIFLAEPIMVAGWGRVWAEAIWPLRALAIGMPFLFLHYPIGYLLNAANLQTKNTINIAITVIVNIAANLLFVEQFGYKSVALISAGSSVLLFCLGLWQVRHVITIPVRGLWQAFAKTAGTGALVAALGWALLPKATDVLGTAVVVGIMAVVYLLAMFAFGLLRWEQIQQIFQRFRRA